MEASSFSCRSRPGYHWALHTVCHLHLISGPSSCLPSFRLSCITLRLHIDINLLRLSACQWMTLVLLQLYYSPLNSIRVFWVTAAFNLMAPLSLQIMIGEGILYCCLSKRRNGIGTEANINAGGCNFNSFLRRAVRFVGGFQLLLPKKNFPHTFSFHHASLLLWNSLSEQCRAVTSTDLLLENMGRNSDCKRAAPYSVMQHLHFPFPLSSPVLLSVFLKE